MPKLPKQQQKGSLIRASVFNELLAYCRSITPKGSPTIQVNRLTGGSTISGVAKTKGKGAGEQYEYTGQFYVKKKSGSDNIVQVYNGSADDYDSASIAGIVNAGTESISVDKKEITISENSSIYAQITYDSGTDTYSSDIVTVGTQSESIWTQLIADVIWDSTNSKIDSITQQWNNGAMQVIGRYV